ncbi:MAG: efflux RND transporter periplasmic adaptor subunit [candidate division KSB1 bacterium]|nr:efflux RND transporter periplasmic adaptor subunit [candidate division KSB1 bacterium]MDZ7276510.1 efflux RND transporter periplasmic adaptor subunit [candidate division KSB1 bacterium]MDZ7286709.1 efflux RND transporter periplasmic adaptor subunit [candidate division KSB1 bacterium]MDZ7300280.1 efflux RND transporter periplasmic adaptor subunit [candidate division KSB1 bacterium]MDZ7307881.1 efflux RND transporter periplasmic adaptor subunit [candidate division KSB1 bacterium]
MKMKRSHVISIFALLAVLAFGYFMVWPRQAGKPEADSVAPAGRLVKINRGDLNAVVSATGKLEPITKVEVKSKASGQIMAMPVEEGDRVEQGALIARIDETDARNTYEQAVADLEVAKATVTQTANNVARQEEMFKRGLISQAEFDQVKLEEVRARAQLVKAETEVSTMLTRLRDCVVRAPISGLILQKNVEAGQIISSGINSVSGGTLIATVANLDSMYVFAEVDEIDVGQVQIGQPARVVPDAFPERVYHGRVLRIAPLATVEQNVTTFNVTVIVSNTDGRLKAGMNATVDITVADRENVLLVPKEALKELREIRTQLQALNLSDSSMAGRMRRPPDSSRAEMRRRFAGVAGAPAGEARGPQPVAGNGRVLRKFVLLKSGESYQPRAVEIGLSNNEYAEVLHGLEEGDEVFVFSGSRAGMDRQAWMNRMRGMTGFGGPVRPR